MTRTLKHVVLAFIVFIWVLPFFALVTTSLRSETASKTSGFWTAFTPTELGHRFGTHDKGDSEPFTTKTGNIFERLNGDRDTFEIDGEVNSILFTGRVPDPDNPEKTKLIRQLIFAGEPMDVRGGNFVFQSNGDFNWTCLLYTSPSPRDATLSRMPSSA